MKQIIPLLLFLILGFSLNAQISVSDAEVTVDTSTVDLSDDFSRVKAHADMTNTSSGDLALKWQINIINAPSEWLIQLCDNNACYAYGEYTNYSAMGNLQEPVYLSPDSSSILEPGLRPVGVAGTGVYDVVISTIDDPGTILGTIRYTFIIDGITALNEVVKSAIKVYPNPATSFFTIENSDSVNEIEIYNIVGKKMATHQVVNGKSINVSNLPLGLYLVRMMDNDGDVIKTTRLTKR